jgi:hypothetical protein
MHAVMRLIAEWHKSVMISHGGIQALNTQTRKGKERQESVQPGKRRFLRYFATEQYKIGLADRRSETSGEHQALTLTGGEPMAFAGERAAVAKLIEPR